MRVRNPQALKGWLPLHLEPGLVKPWRGVWPDQRLGKKLWVSKNRELTGQRIREYNLTKNQKLF